MLHKKNYTQSIEEYIYATMALILHEEGKPIILQQNDNIIIYMLKGEIWEEIGLKL